MDRQSKVERARDNGQPKVERARDNGQPKVERARDNGQPKIERVRDNGQSKVERARDNGQPKVERVRDNGQSKVERARDKGQSKVERVTDNGQRLVKIQSGRTRGIMFGRRVTTAAVCGIMLAILIGVFIAGTLITEADVAPDFSRKGLPPSFQYPFGTDWLGRNMLLRTIKGLSLSIKIGGVASAVSAVLAVLIGMTAAIGSRRLDSAVLWVIDLVMGIPHLVLLILISFACGRGFTGLLVGIAVTHWTGLARLVRAEVLQIRSQQYITVSRKLGHSYLWILKSHIVPHLVPQFLVGIILLFPHAVLHESSLSFLGYGLPPEQPAIGIILSESMRYLTGGMWWLAVFPGALLAAVVVMFDKLGDNLRALLDPCSAQE